MCIDYRVKVPSAPLSVSRYDEIDGLCPCEYAVQPGINDKNYGVDFAYVLKKSLPKKRLLSI